MKPLPKILLVGDDKLWQKKEELKRKLQYAQNNKSEEKPKKIKWGQLILGFIGMGVGIFSLAQASSSTGALIGFFLMIVFFVIYLAIRNK